MDEGGCLFESGKKSYDDIIGELELLSDPEAISGMAKFGITPGQCYGVSVPNLRLLAKEAGKDHDLAQRLWDAGYRETMIIATIVEIPELVTEEQMEAWVLDFDYWEICDQCCMNLFQKTSFSYQKSIDWSERDEEFVKRAGFVLMARMAVADKKAKDTIFEDFLPRYETVGRSWYESIG